MKLFEEKPKTVGKIILVPIAQISPSPHQPRRSFDPEGLDTLAKSIAQNGLLVPVSLRADEEGYTLIAGERRLRACQSLGMSEIPAMVLKKDEEDAAVLTLIENLHRENLDCFEEAMGILRVMQMGGISQAKVCAMLGKSQPAVANKLRLLRLPPEVRKTCRELRLGERICRALLALDGDEDKQLEACRHIHEHQLSAGQAEEYVSDIIQRPGTPRKKQATGTLRDCRLLFSPVDRAVKEIRRLGFQVKAETTEDADYISYIIRVPKNPARGRKKLPLDEPVRIQA